MHSSILHNLGGRRRGDHADQSPSPNLNPVKTGGSMRSTGSSDQPARSNVEPLALAFRIETPPIVMYGPPNESVGAMLSGVLDMNVTGDENVTVTNASMAVIQEIHFKNLPSHVASVLPAQLRVEELAVWQVLDHESVFRPNVTFNYPFSHLLPGALPPTCSSSLFTVKYLLVAKVMVSGGHKVEIVSNLHVGRSVPLVQDKTSVRVFPPTELTLSMIVPSAVFPKSDYPAELRLEGIIGPKDPNTGRIRRWIVKKISWRMQEVTVLTPPESEPYEHRRIVATGQHKSGWKTDFHIEKGLVEYSVPNFCPNALDSVSCDVQDSVAGISLSHNLIVEILIAEEMLASSSQRQPVLTGSARILRMQFSTQVTERPGLGISWEDEVPPMYADVPLSPPTYDTVANMPSLEEISNMTFSPAVMPQVPSPSPTFRHVDPSLREPEFLPTTAAARLARLRLHRDGGDNLLAPSMSAPVVDSSRRKKGTTDLRRVKEA